MWYIVIWGKRKEFLQNENVGNAVFTIRNGITSITGIGSFSPLVSVRKKIVYSVEKTHLFKISNLVYIHSSIQYSVWRQVQSLLQNDAST